MNEIVYKFLLAGDKVMHEMHLRQPGFIYSACEPFTKNKERIQKFKETGYSRHIYQNELDKSCFQHGMAYGDFIDLTRRTASDKILRDKAFNIAKNPKHDPYQRGLAAMVYKCFDKETSGCGIKNKNMSDQSLAEELHKLIIERFKKIKVHSTFIDNIWGADLADRQIIKRFNKRFRFLLCIIPLKDKIGITTTNGFQKMLDKSNRKPNKVWVDKGSEFYNRSM